MAVLPRGYEFYFALPESYDDGKLDSSDVLITFPITPSELTISSGSRNETVDLIDGGEINILKSPSLIEIQFDARFPMREYPYSRVPLEFQKYFDKFAELKTNKQPFRFIVSRSNGESKAAYDTNLLVALEDFETHESADEGDDIICSFKLKQYKPYGVKTLSADQYWVNRDTNGKGSGSSSYTVKSGDCLWNIAKAYYGDGSKWKIIYDANKDVIEETANKYRDGKGSSNGHWIYPGTKLIIPGVGDSSNMDVDTLGKSSEIVEDKITGEKSYREQQEMLEMIKADAREKNKKKHEAKKHNLRVYCEVRPGLTVIVKANNNSYEAHKASVTSGSRRYLLVQNIPENSTVYITANYSGEEPCTGRVVINKTGMYAKQSRTLNGGKLQQFSILCSHVMTKASEIVVDTIIQ